MLIKLIIIAMLIAIIASLFAALYRLVRVHDEAQRISMAKALTVRVGLSITLFVLLLSASHFGIIPPLK